MVTIAVPKKIVHKREDLIILPRLEYEALLKRKGIREVKLTVGERRAVKESEKELAFQSASHKPLAVFPPMMRRA